MGIELKERRRLYPHSHLIPERNDEYVFLDDMTETLQQTIPMDACMTPREIVNSVYFPELHKGNHSVYVMCADNSKLMPEARATYLYPSRYKKDEYVGDIEGSVYDIKQERYFKHTYAPIDDDLAKTTTPDHMPAAWTNLKSSTAGKKCMYTAIEDSIIQKILFGKGAKPGCVYILIRLDGTVFMHPERSFDLPSFTYGEADQLVVHMALYFKTVLNKSVFIRSRDWDVIGSLWTFNCRDIKVNIGRVFVDVKQKVLPSAFDKESCQLTKRGAKKLWGNNHVRMYEIINIDDMLHIPQIRRMHFVFFALCGGGGDYCKEGLTRFGFTESPMRNLAQKSISNHLCFEIVCDETNVMARTFRFYPKRFLQLLLSERRIKARSDNLLEFNDIVHRIIYNLRYYAGFDTTRTPGGPPLPDVDVPLFQTDVDTVTALLLSTKKMDDYYYDIPENYPWCLEAMPYALSFVFDDDHADTIAVAHASEA